MFEQVQLILFNLLQYKRALQEQARAIATWRHNADLCPSVQWQCEAILATIERHRSVVYDTQGPGDAGTDVLIALNYKEETRYIGFQIKSEVEVSKDTLKTLKAQWVDAQNRFDERLLDYYILLAWDPKLRAQAIRLVSQTFSTTRRVHVIEPAYLWTFLNGLSSFQMQALITAYLSDEDPLLRRAKRMISAAFCISCFALQRSQQPRTNLGQLRSIYSCWSTVPTCQMQSSRRPLQNSLNSTARNWPTKPGMLKAVRQWTGTVSLLNSCVEPGSVQNC